MSGDGMAEQPTAEIGNPILSIQNRLQKLRNEREMAQFDIDNLDLEKNVIRQTIPKILQTLNDKRDSINASYKEMKVYDTAIQNIEEQYGHILFTKDFFDESEQVVSFGPYKVNNG